MTLTDKIIEKIGGAFGWVIFRELRQIRLTLERGIDSQREIVGLQPLFGQPKSEVDRQIEEELAEPAAQAEIAQMDGEPDHLRLEILELLARDHQILVTSETDLVALGRSRGWLDESGAVTMLPKNYP